VTPDRTESAAVACESLAAHLDRQGPASTRMLVFTAQQLVAVPLDHYLRGASDLVLAMAETVRAGAAEPGALRELAGLLRAGAAGMASTGWYPVIFGGSA
jgi:hypothetical protein